jgi:hypothetical protein
MTLVFMASSKSNKIIPLLDVELVIDACTFMKHAHPSYAHIVSNVTYTLGEIRTKIYCSNSISCVASSI